MNRAARRAQKAAASVQKPINRINSAPSPHEMQHLIGLFQQRQYDEAQQAAQTLTARYPRDGFGWKALATILYEQNHWAEAIEVCRKASGLLAQDAEFHNTFANCLKNVDEVAEAETHYKRAVALNPSYVEAYDNLGVLLHQQERLEESEKHLRKAIALRPSYGPAHEHLANMLLVSCRIAEAERCYQDALAIQPNSAKIHNNLGSLLHGASRFAEAEASFRRALTLDPHYAPAYNSLGHLLASHGFHTDAEACFRGALHFQADHAVAHSNLLFSMAHREVVTPEALFAEHKAFGVRFEQPLRSEWPQHTNSREPERRLRVGMISGDLHDHALIRYLKPVLKHLTHYPEFSLHAYSNDMIEDHVTAELKTYFHKWRQVSFLTDKQLAQEIQKDEIDIVLDLSGHTGYNRLLAMVRKPAPIQIGWMGYVGTSGLECMDYFIADHYFVPPSFASQFTEKLMYLPAATPFQPYEPSPDVNELPALKNGYVTIGSFHRVSKLNRQVIAVWSQILRAVPSARLLLAAMPDGKPPSLLLKWFAEESITEDRLTFVETRGVEPTLRMHHEIDFCLDAFPYGGSTTGNHSLWMGVPTLTLAGATVPGRMGAALAGHVGFEGFTAASKADFVEKAIYWAQHPEELAGLRKNLRQRFADSIFLQPNVITAALAKSLRTAWKRWCAGLPAETFVSDSEKVYSGFPEGV